MNDIAIIQKDNVNAIAQQAPIAFKANQVSHDRCLEKGQALLDTIEANGGLNDELDKEVADYIKRSRNTVTKMNNGRSAVTKLFDEIRGVFTGLENDVDPTKKGTIPNTLQNIRNDYAAQKRAEAEEKRREEEKRQRIAAMKTKYYTDLENAFKQNFNMLLNYRINDLSRIFSEVTLQNYNDHYNKIKGISRELTRDDLVKIFTVNIMRPIELNQDELKAIRDEVIGKVKESFEMQYATEVSDNCDSFMDMLPSKKTELEAISKASAEEAAKREEEMKKREAEEAAKCEEERLKKEAEEATKAKLEQEQQSIGGLFDQAKASVSTYQPMTSVKQKIEIDDPRGILDILNFWWIHEGVNLSLEDLQKKFKSQISFAEKMANAKEPMTIKSDSIRYVDEVKAK